MAYNESIVLGILQTRLDRGGLAVPESQLEYWKQRVMAADAELERQGIHLQDDIDDNVFLADIVAWKINNRDKPGGMPDWLRLQMRERWISTKGREEIVT